MSEQKVVWMTSTPEGVPALQEKSFTGTIAQAIAHVVDSLATEMGFLLGQVLGEDGRVAANIAPGGSLRVTDKS